MKLGKLSGWIGYEEDLAGLQRPSIIHYSLIYHEHTSDGLQQATKQNNEKTRYECVARRSRSI